MEGVVVPPVGCTFTPSIGPLAPLPLISTYGSPCPMASRCAVVQDGLCKTGPATVGAGVAGSTPVCMSPSMASLSGLLGTLAGLLPCPTSVKEVINLAICCPNSAVPSQHLVATAALALTLSWISFSLSAFWVAAINCEYNVPGVL